MANLTDHVFAELRPHLAVLLRLPLDSVRPETPLASYLPLTQRRKFRRVLASRTQLKVPELQYRPTVQVHFWICIVAALASGGLAIYYGWPGFALPLGALAGCMAAVVDEMIARRLVEDEEHPSITTLGDLAQWTLARNMKTCRERYRLNANHAEILTTIRAILLEQMDVDPRRVTEEFCFAELD